MRICAKLFLLLALFCCCSFGVGHQTLSNIVDVKQGIGPGGTWKTKLEWKSYWVKDWELKQMYVPLWKRVWGPVEIREWLPLPNPHPGVKRH